MTPHKAPHRGWMPPVRHLNLYVDEDFPEPDTLFDTYEGRASGAAQQEMTLARHFTFVDLKIMPEENDLAVSAERTPAESAWRRALSRLTPEQLQAYRDALAERNRPFAELSRDSQDWVRYTYQRYMQDYLAVITAMDENIGRLLDYLDTSGLAENTIVIYTSDQGFYLGEHGWYDKRWMYEQSLHTPLLIRYYDLDEWELFDLQRDPNEMQSVYGDPEYRDVQAEMAERLRELREQYGDT